MLVVNIRSVIGLDSSGAFVPAVGRGVIAALVANDGQADIWNECRIISVNKSPLLHAFGRVEGAPIPVFGAVEAAVVEKFGGENTAVLSTWRKI